MKAKIKRILTACAILALTMTAAMGFTVGVSAAEWEAFPEISVNFTEVDASIPNFDENNKDIIAESGDFSQDGEEDSTNDSTPEANVFDQIYRQMEANADKIFSILAFIGTLVVGIGYKSGLLPLLRDALSRLKGAIDEARADGEVTKTVTAEKLESISKTVEDMDRRLGEMEWQYESYDKLCTERKATCLILTEQINMLYAIFMSSALPQYQKDEIGERIAEMREELKSYEAGEEN